MWRPYDGPMGELPGTVLELKTYVIWGRAYMGSVHDYLFFRDGTTEHYPPGALRTMLHGHSEGTVGAARLHWIHAEGQLERALLMAEAAALTSGMDMVRFDFFLRKGDPDGIVFNENSISSASSPIYHHHFDNMAHAWARGHLEQWFGNYSGHGKRTYELSLLHPGGHPNEQRIRKLLADNADLAQRVGLGPAHGGAAAPA